MKRLKDYKAKRIFSNTPEPRGSEAHQPSLKFCVQKHNASHLHYDFRLEHQGVLLSWAIPKGPSLDPSVKRLAIKVEDHPLDYIDFEGTIPPGNYGAGTVLVWDLGDYSIPKCRTQQEMNRHISEGLQKGHLEFELNGEKLKGRFDFIRLKQNESSWLLIKQKDQFATNDDVLMLDYSVKTTRKTSTKSIPHEIKPMLATLIDQPFNKEGWLFETKWDGYRALAYIKKDHISLLSRNHQSFNTLFSPITSELANIPPETILDGEVVILDKEGRSQFQLIQNYQSHKNKFLENHLYYYVFDLLFYKGQDLREEPLIKRKNLLKQLIHSSSLSFIRYTDHIENNGTDFFHKAVEYQMEGIVGKKMDSPYLSKRSSDWVKIKTHLRQEAVIGGFTSPRGSRKKFGALLLGVYEGSTLIYIGHSGGGFSEQELSDIHSLMQTLIQEKCPFEKEPKANALATWIKPKLVCEVSFSEWTQEGMMRHPIYQGLRVDKKAKEVKRETPKPTVELKKNPPSATNLDKVYWPDQNYTKKDLLDYYQAIAPFILPHLIDHPITLHRYPEGIEGNHFFQKDTSSLHLPSSVKTIVIRQENRDLQYIMIQNISTLLYVINLGSIELHPFLAKAANLEHPSQMVIDLDPVNIAFEKVIEVAQLTHEFLEEINVKSFCKTSGKRGLHICIPLNEKYTFDQAKQFGQLIALIIHQKLPKITSLERKPANREKKVYIDVYQNNLGQTVVAPYSVRAVPFATISTPLNWDEVKKGLNPQHFTIKTVPERLQKLGDPFKSLLKGKINLLDALKKLS
jgi:bifunctional non-homologous end joining protein LigD